MEKLTLGFNAARKILNRSPFMATNRIQKKVLERTNVSLDGRTIAGLKVTLHRRMVGLAA